MKKTWILAALFATTGLVASASASEVLQAAAHAGTITISPTGVISVTHAPGGNYDGTEDVVYNVENQSNVIVTGFTVTGTGISEFDLDGIDNYVDANGNLLSGASFGVIIDGPAYTAGNTTGPTNGTSVGSDYVGYANGVKNVYTGFTSDLTGTGADHVDILFGGGGYRRWWELRSSPLKNQAVPTGQST